MGSPPVAGTALPIWPLDARSVRDDDDASDALADTTGFGGSLLGLGTASGLAAMAGTVRRSDASRMCA